MNAFETRLQTAFRPSSSRVAITCGGELEGIDQLPLTLSQTLLKAAKDASSSRLIHIGPDGRQSEQSYANLLDEAKRILCGFRRLGLQPGDKIIFQCELSRDFLPAFWGAVLGGFVPVPISVPGDYAQDNASVSKVRHAWRLLDEPLVLTCAARETGIRALERFPEMNTLRAVAVETLRLQPPDDVLHEATSDDLALMMLTSGSTGVPKGVMLTHRNLVSRSAGSVQMNGFSRADISLSWMPLDHVASLIYFHLRDVFTGCTQIHVSPGYILQNPLRWLDLLERFRVTVTFAPNFAFGLINERAVEMERRHWDLSSVRFFLNGGEAVVPRTARRFMQLAAAHRVRPDSMWPAWGMSEISSGVTYGDRFRLDSTADSDPFAEVGLPIPGTWLRIVNEHDEPVCEGETGRLQFKGTTLMAGYYNNPRANAEAFTKDGWFKTGDLGYLRDGRLTITGREKDVIIINGVNYYSHEIESVVEQVTGVEVSFVGACAVRSEENEPEKLAVFFSCTEEAKANLPALLQEIRTQVSLQNGIKPEYLVPLEKHEIPKTEIGKIQRAKLKARFEAGEFAAVLRGVQALFEEERRRHAPVTDTEKQMASVWSEVLGTHDVGRHESFLSLGGASLAANRVISRVRELFQVELPLALLFDTGATLEQVAQFVDRQERLSTTEMVNVPADQPVPVSFAQQRIWIAEQMDPGTCRFNVARALWLDGDLDYSALEKALNTIIRRHDILRTSFRFEGNQPLQLVDDHLTVAIPVVDVSGEDNREQAAIARASVELEKPFNLEQTPLLRAVLIRTEQSRHLFAICFHQIIVDGWSIGVLFDEFAACYQGLSAERDCGLALLPVQYRDYAAWQRQRSDLIFADQIEYWKSNLAGSLPQLDWLQQKTISSRAQTERLVLPKALCEKLKEFNQQQGTTLFMTLLAAFKVLLRSRNTTDDISVGTAVSGRNRTEIENLIGFFVNTVVLRDEVSLTMSFEALLERVRATCLGAFAHADVPFEKLVESLQSERGADRANFFQVWFSFMDSMSEFMMGMVRAHPIHLAPPEAQFDFSLFIVERPEEIDCFFEYKTELLSAQTVRVLMETYQTILERVVEKPGVTLEQLFSTAQPARPGESKRQSFQTIHEWIEQQAARTPDSVAVTCGTESIRYGQLNRRANQLARYLQKQGVRRGAFVGISLPRSVEMIVSILGVLKAGAAYVPLDPAYPQERIEQMLMEIQSPVLLSNSSVAGALPLTGATILCLDEIADAIVREDDSNHGKICSNEDFAYAIFTSGSTGRPKGVPIKHRNLVFSNEARFAYYKEPIHAYLMISSFSFDSSVAGIFWTLCSGGNLVLPEEGKHRDPRELIRAIEANGVTHFLGLPSLYNLMLQEPDAARMRSLRTVVVAGESCSKELVDRHAKQLPQTRLFNEYGPTEATVWSTVAELKPGAKVTIGHAIPGARVYLLDEQMNLAAPGESGELFVGGPGVACGYLNRPEVSAVKFLPDPFGPEPDGMLYRTGDLARYDSNGEIEFLGRIDNQVKIRGFRIELEEVEAALQEYPGVRSGVVHACEPHPGFEKILTAYIVSAQGIERNDLKQFLRQRLPEYMVPSAFVFLDALPLMPNGKVDRSALPAPKKEEAVSDAYVAPRTPTEQQIAAIWQELLHRDRIGISENFFELGGHSLLGIQVMARVREQFQVDMPLKHIFESPTIEGLAERVFEYLIASSGQPAIGSDSRL